MSGNPDTVLVMGVCGVGKSTLARALAERCGSGFVEADDYHPPENIAAMSNGVPLTDAMRWGWLDRVAGAVGAERAAEGAPVFLACSSLKKSYRDRLRQSLEPITILYLHADKDLLSQRVSEREGHFMSPKLLDSQIAVFEPPDAEENAVLINATVPAEAIVADVIRRLKLPARETKNTSNPTVSRRTIP